jgi:hypothetical protein
VHREVHAGCGRGPQETDRWQHRHRACGPTSREDHLHTGVPRLFLVPQRVRRVTEPAPSRHYRASPDVTRNGSIDQQRQHAHSAENDSRHDGQRAPATRRDRGLIGALHRQRLSLLLPLRFAMCVRYVSISRARQLSANGAAPGFARCGGAVPVRGVIRPASGEVRRGRCSR